ncbi:MAG: hypothetical protein U9R79_18135, partial [Armatimonadota bacterium]|nr:hypothetical protein [Armatimonadota bacterium]
MTMQELTAIAAAMMVLVCAAGTGQAAERFEVAAWVDHFDFARVYDSETPDGCDQILEHVQETGVTTILWRNCAGSTMRYQSKVESHHQDAPWDDKREIPDTRDVYGWVRYGQAQPDLLAHAMQSCGRRALRPGVHWPFEETHGAIWTIGRWNMEHPQLWGRTRDGQMWWGRCSLAYEETVRHKLDLVDELIDRGIECLFIETRRSGGWSPAYEYVEPVVEAWREEHGTEPPPADDLQWCRHVSGYVTDFIRRVRERLEAADRDIELLVGVPHITLEGSEPLIMRGLDWRTLAQQELIDTLVINYVPFDRERPFESTREICSAITDFAGDRCDVLWPVAAYNPGNSGMPAYQELTGLSRAEVARRLTLMAWEEGAAGISLECVDYNNY